MFINEKIFKYNSKKLLAVLKNATTLTDTTKQFKKKLIEKCESLNVNKWLNKDIYIKDMDKIAITIQKTEQEKRLLISYRDCLISSYDIYKGEF